MSASIADLGSSGASGASSPLAWAVTASIALHAALIAGIPEVWNYSPAPATALLNARLEPGMPASTADADPAGEPAKQPRPPVERAAAPRPAKSAPAAERRDETRHDVTQTREPATPAAPPQQAALQSTTGAGGTSSGEPTLAPHPGDEAPDLGSIAQFRLALIGAAKRHRLYPESAVERGWQGRVTVRLEFGSDGTLAEALVRRSSGHGSLDRQAVEMLRKAAALTPLPPALRSREFSVEVPVLFELRGEG
jgi:protein TonB